MRLAVSTDLYRLSQPSAAVKEMLRMRLAAATWRIPWEFRQEGLAPREQLAPWHVALREANVDLAAVEIPAAILGSDEFPHSADAWLEAAKEAGAGVCVIAPGDDTAIAPLGRVTARLRDLGRIAGRRNMLVTVGLHAEWASDTREMCELLGNVACDAVRMHFDPRRFLCLNRESQVEIAVQRLLGWIGSLALSDFDGDDQVGESPPLGQGGHVGFARLLEIMRAYRFSGVCVIERGGGVRRRKGPTDAQWLDQSLEHLGRCGWLDGV